LLFKVEKTVWKQPDLTTYILPEKKKRAKVCHTGTEMFHS